MTVELVIDQRPLDFSGYGVPKHTQEALERYINHRICPGSFLGAVLSNDLKQAVSRADEENKLALVEIVYWLHNRAPSYCWGSVELFKNYLNRK